MTNNWVIPREHISFFTGDNDNIEGIGLNFWRTAVGYLSKKEISINLNTNISEEEVIKSINFLFNSVHVPRKRRNYFKNYRFSTIYHGKTLHLVFTNMKEINCNNCRVNFLDNKNIKDIKKKMNSNTISIFDFNVDSSHIDQLQCLKCYTIKQIKE